MYFSCRLNAEVNTIFAKGRVLHIYTYTCIPCPFCTEVKLCMTKSVLIHMLLCTQ